MTDAAPPLDALATLAASEDVRDRAFVFGALGLSAGLSSDRGPAHAAVLERLRRSAAEAHAATREAIRRGEGRARLLDEVSAAPLDVREHLVEEILGVAYPPFAAHESELVLDATSGLAEILFAVDEGRLAPGRTLVDLGSGTGKVGLLAAVLSGASVRGLEIEPALVELANGAARELALDASFAVGDLRDAALPAGDVYYMYIPLLRSDAIVERLAPRAAERAFTLLAQALDVRRFPWLRARARESYWLRAYDADGVDPSAA